MRSRAALLILLAALWPGAGAGAPTVVMLSWDGTRHDYPERGALPALSRMAREGARAEHLVPVFPSSTFPNHVSLATGAYPDRHGIVGNRFRDRSRGLFDHSKDASWILAEPIWIAAERQAVTSAVFFWVGSETPWRGLTARYRMAPFDADIPEAAKVRQILAWLDLPEALRPRLILSWWHGADRAGHLDGPDASSVRDALVLQDQQLAALLAGLDARVLWSDVTLLVVSDHGMTSAVQGIPLEDRLASAGIEAETLLETAVAHVFLADPAERPRAREALAGLPGVSLYAPDDLPAALRLGPPSRIGDLVLVAEPSHTFRMGILARLARFFDLKIGAHGYAPDHTDMRGIFYALGRGVPAGARLSAVHATEVAPTIAHLLGIEPPLHAEGQRIPGIEPARAVPEAP